MAFHYEPQVVGLIPATVTITFFPIQNQKKKGWMGRLRRSAPMCIAYMFTTKYDHHALYYEEA